MKLLIILYLLLTFTMTYVQTYAGLPQDAGVSMSGTATNVQSTLESQSQAYQGADKSTIGLITMVHSYLSVIATMTTFRFEIGGAPPEINVFLRGLFGILSVLFWGSIARSFLSVIPFTGG